ncbi:MAG: putative toxin-antitoxin system toxin component, PIN family [Bacteroidota bacterium]|nr:putative toxin-antitoxin system toxin component, PIN family [Bacteroidota bacterium]
MANKPDRLVVDTNVFISFLISDSFSKLDKHVKSGKIVFLLSEELLSEFLEVASRPKLKKYFSEKDINKLLDAIQDNAEFIDVSSKVNICRDHKDNFLLSLCLDGKADFLITGDEDLLVLKKIKKTSILKISEYLKR